MTPSCWYIPIQPCPSLPTPPFPPPTFVVRDVLPEVAASTGPADSPFPAPLPPFPAFTFSSQVEDTTLGTQQTVQASLPSLQILNESDSGRELVSLSEGEGPVVASRIISHKRKRGKSQDGNNSSSGDSSGNSRRRTDSNSHVPEEDSGGYKDDDYEEGEGDDDDYEGEDDERDVHSKPKRSKGGRSKRRRLGSSHVAAFLIPPCPRGGLSFASWSVAHSVRGGKGGKAVEFIGVLGAAGGDCTEWGDSGCCGWVEGLMAEFNGQATGTSIASQHFLENSIESLLNRCRRGDIMESAAAFVQKVNLIQLVAKVKRCESHSDCTTDTDVVHLSIINRTGDTVSQILQTSVRPTGVAEGTFKGWLNKGAKYAAIAAGGNFFPSLHSHLLTSEYRHFIFSHVSLHAG
jgi:hypothetical protein